MNIFGSSVVQGRLIDLNPPASAQLTFDNFPSIYSPPSSPNHRHSSQNHPLPLPVYHHVFHFPYLYCKSLNRESSRVSTHKIWRWRQDFPPNNWRLCTELREFSFRSSEGLTLEFLQKLANRYFRKHKMQGPNCLCLKYANKRTPDRGPLFVHRNLWRYIESGGKSKYYIIGNFCLLILMGANEQKFYWRKRDLIRYQRLNFTYCIFPSNSTYVQPDDGINK